MLCMALAGLCTGCRAPSVEDVSGTELRARSGMGSIWCDLPVEPVYPMATMVAAAEEGLRSRGYVVINRRGVLEEPARVGGRMGGVHDVHEAVVWIDRSGPRARVEVKIEPWGNEAEGRALMGAVLMRLGY